MTKYLKVQKQQHYLALVRKAWQRLYRGELP